MGEPERIMSVQEYLAFERESEIRHEYVDGEIFAMSGASRKHNRISWNIVEALGPQLREGGCEGFVSDMRVLIPKPTTFHRGGANETFTRRGTDETFTYPDVVVACDEPRFYDEEALETLLNPTLIVEVLSPSTEDYDRGRKFASYRTIPSLQLYLLVSQDRVHVERFERQSGGIWTLYETDDLAEKLELPAISASLTLADVYYRVPGLVAPA